jgi:hypothetical protein
MTHFSCFVCSVSILERVVPLITEALVEATAEGTRRGHLARELVPLLTSATGILHKLFSLAASRPDHREILASVRISYLDTLKKRIFCHLPFRCTKPMQSLSAFFPR